MDYSIKIDNFEGPLDLLLHLIKESNIDIYDISINDITKQYMDYLNKMEELNINVASSYLVMAAELMEIKSKSLLPGNTLEDDSEEEVSRESLINKLILYKQYKEMSPIFRSLESERKNIYIKGPENLSKYVDDSNLYRGNEDVSLLVDAFKKYLERVEREKPVTTKIVNKEYSIKDRKVGIKNILKERHQVKFTELFTEYNISYLVVTFLSILELTKDNEVSIIQDRNFSDIIIKEVK